MSPESAQPGNFLFSLDTELAWGWFDDYRPGRYSEGGVRERQVIARLLEILDEFEITATWALVGHLFYAKCEECIVCPVRDWQGKYASYDQVYGTADRLWYADDLVQLLLCRGARHEIGCHGYTHRIFDERSLNAKEARVEIGEWQRVAARAGVRAASMVFPRNRAGHLPLFKDAGFTCYRGDELHPPDYYSLPLIGKAINLLDLRLQFRTPQVYNPRVDPFGLVNLPASRGFFQIDRRVDHALDSLGLGRLRIARIKRGVERAAREGKTVHIWAHPCEFRRESDLEKLRELFACVAEQVRQGRMRSVSMGQLADEVLTRQGQEGGA